MGNNLQRRTSGIACKLLAILSVGCLARFVWAQDQRGGKSLAAVENHGEKGSDLRITIWVYNYAEVRPSTLAAAKIRIAKILDRAGVTTSWTDCPISVSETEEQATCQERMAPTELGLMIFHKFKLPDGVSRDSYLGSAEVFSNRQPGHYVYLSYDHIRDSVYPGDTASPDILAGVAVHEIGHVLCRSIDHSPTGLMRAKWEKQDFQNAAIGNLLFTPKQAEIIRSEVAARMQQAAIGQRKAADEGIK